jgi:hypothetical protein
VVKLPVKVPVASTAKDPPVELAVTIPTVVLPMRIDPAVFGV